MLYVLYVLPAFVTLATYASSVTEPCHVFSWFSAFVFSSWLAAIVKCKPIEFPLVQRIKNTENIRRRFTSEKKWKFHHHVTNYFDFGVFAEEYWQKDIIKSIFIKIGQIASLNYFRNAFNDGKPCHTITITTTGYGKWHKIMLLSSVYLRQSKHFNIQSWFIEN